MAESFDVSPAFLDAEVAELIVAGRLNAKIDKVAGIVETNRWAGRRGGGGGCCRRLRVGWWAEVPGASYQCSTGAGAGALAGCWRGAGAATSVQHWHRSARQLRGGWAGPGKLAAWQAQAPLRLLALRLSLSLLPPPPAAGRT
jgi:hypothetical protein